jgi:hypothetical protein
MLKQNSILVGICMALVFPAIAFVAAHFLAESTLVMNKPALPYLVAIALNLILMRILSKKDMVNTVKGIMIATFTFMLLVLLIVIHPFR